ncbi:MAG: type II toxin-antitoxin system HicB family antitoxin [Deltaproteobacteria bacterium]|nr:type II toxin-antitoxin system HicB family antitoxin [Deltaproteobacteria bacterium]
MGRYPALIDGKKGAYGVTVPTLPGIVAMGKTVDEAMVNAEEALHDYAIEAENDGEAIAPPSDSQRVEIQAGQTLVSILLRRVAEMGG